MTCQPIRMPGGLRRSGQELRADNSLRGEQSVLSLHLLANKNRNLNIWQPGAIICQIIKLLIFADDFESTWLVACLQNN